VPQGSPKRLTMSTFQIRMRFWHPTGEEAFHTQDELNLLVWELRQKIELDPKEPRFLQTERGLGYRLETRPVVG